MNQRDRDRLGILKEVKKKHTKQAEAAKELKISVRQLQRLVKAQEERGDRAVMHALRGQPSNRKIEAQLEQRAEEILNLEEYQGFGPTLASEYLAKRHEIVVSRETVRSWMGQAGLWRGRKRRVEEVHQWRARRSRFGEMVQWATSEHDWLEGRGGGPKLYLNAMIDDATSLALARSVESVLRAQTWRLWSYGCERTDGRCRSIPIKLDCFRPPSRPSVTSSGKARIANRCRRRRLGGRCRSWANINTDWNTHEPASILHEVAIRGNYEAPQFLIDHGIDMTIRDYRWNGTAKGSAIHAYALGQPPVGDSKMAEFLARAANAPEARSL